MPHRDAHLNLIDSSRQLFELDPGAEIEAGAGWVFAAGRSPHPVISNAAFRVDDELDPDELIERARAFFAARERGFAVWARAGAAEDRDLIAGRRGSRTEGRLRDAGDGARPQTRRTSLSRPESSCAGSSRQATRPTTGRSQPPPTPASASRRRSSPSTRTTRASRPATRPPSSPTSTATRPASR